MEIKQKCRGKEKKRKITTNHEETNGVFHILGSTTLGWSTTKKKSHNTTPLREKNNIKEKKRTILGKKKGNTSRRQVTTYKLKTLAKKC